MGRNLRQCKTGKDKKKPSFTSYTENMYAHGLPQLGTHLKEGDAKDHSVSYFFPPAIRNTDPKHRIPITWNAWLWQSPSSWMSIISYCQSLPKWALGLLGLTAVIVLLSEPLPATAVRLSNQTQEGSTNCLRSHLGSVPVQPGFYLLLGGS